MGLAAAQSVQPPQPCKPRAMHNARPLTKQSPQVVCTLACSALLCRSADAHACSHMVSLRAHSGTPYLSISPHDFLTLLMTHGNAPCLPPPPQVFPKKEYDGFYKAVKDAYAQGKAAVVQARYDVRLGRCRGFWANLHRKRGAGLAR